MKRSADEAFERDTNDDSYQSKDKNVSVLGVGRRKCPYLDTVNRQKLDFDQLKVCSVTITNMNVYACLICGKYFQGKGKSTPAYTHSVQMNHFVFINLQDTRTFCLPDDYEIIDAALSDVKRCLAPSYSMQEIERLNVDTALARDVYGVSYLPGFVGLNNLQCTDYTNVMLHALSHVTPLRDYFLQDPIPCFTASSSSGSSRSGSGSQVISNSIVQEKYPMIKAFADIAKKMWSRDSFKSVISPAEFAHVLNVHSNGRFSVSHRMEVSDLYNWLLNEIHKNIVSIAREEYKADGSGSLAHARKGSKKNGIFSSIVYETFQGEVEVRTKKLTITANTEENDNDVIKVQQSPFIMLALDIPPSPLFRDSQGAAVIPQIPLFELLKKFDGQTWTDKVCNSDSEGPVRKQYIIRRLPRYLVLHLKRFSQDGFGFAEDKNSTIVTFPLKNLEMKDYYKPPVARSTDPGAEGEKASSATAVITKYDLVANICHDTLTAQSITSGLTTNSSTKASSTVSTAAVATAEKTSLSASSTALNNGSYRIHLVNKATNQWFEIQDLHVSETMPQLVGLSESNMLIYERQQPPPKLNTQSKEGN